MLADTIVQMALARVGASYGGHRRAEYLAHQYPGDTLAAATQMGSRQSGCLLTARGCLAHQRRADGSPEVDGVISWHGARVDVLRAPYASASMLGQIEGVLVELARQRDQEGDPTRGPEARILKTDLWKGDAPPHLEPGDFVIIGSGGSAPADPAAKAKWASEWGGLVHGFIVTGVGDGGLAVESVDGGQTDPANGGHPTAILARSRRLERRASGWWAVNAPGGPGRRLNRRIRAGLLPLLPAS